MSKSHFGYIGREAVLITDGGDTEWDRVAKEHRAIAEAMISEPAREVWEAADGIPMFRGFEGYPDPEATRALLETGHIALAAEVISETQQHEGTL